MKASFLIVLFAFSLFLTMPANAQGNFGVSVSPPCVSTVPGTTVTYNVSASLGSIPIGSQPENITVAGIPQASSVTFQKTGQSSLNSTMKVQVGSKTSPGTYQIAVIASLGTTERVVFITLQVVTAQQGQAQTGAGECVASGLRIPESTIVVTLTSVGLGLITQLATRRFVNLKAERKMRAEVAAFNKEKREATLAKDNVKLEKLKKRELPMRQEQAKVSTARLKVTGITFAPLLIVYYLMATYLGGYNVIVAVSPVPIPLLTTTGGLVALFWWYFLSSFTFSTILGKIMKTTT